MPEFVVATTSVPTGICYSDIQEALIIWTECSFITLLFDFGTPCSAETWLQVIICQLNPLPSTWYSYNDAALLIYDILFPYEIAMSLRDPIPATRANTCSVSKVKFTRVAKHSINATN